VRQGQTGNLLSVSFQGRTEAVQWRIEFAAKERR